MKTRLLIRMVAVALVCFSCESAFAKLNFPVEARLFAGVTDANPTQVNSELNTLGISDMKNIAQYGLELTYPLATRFEVGVRYAWRSDHEDDPTNINNYADLSHLHQLRRLGRDRLQKIFRGVRGRLRIE